MAQIQRLKATEIQNGQTINAEDINVELDQLVNSSNEQDTEITAITSTSSTFSGVKSFANGLRSDVLEELTAEAGVTIDGVGHKDGKLYPYSELTPVSPQEGELWYNAEHGSLQTLRDGQIRVLTGVHKSWVSGPVPEYLNGNQIRLPQGLMALEDTGQTVIEITQVNGLVLDVTLSGEAGLDFGSLSPNTWYYLWLCKGESGTTAIFSTSQENPVLPTGYDSYKRRYPYLALRSDANSFFLYFIMNPVSKEVYYPGANYNSADYMFVQSAPVTTTPITVSLAGVVPPIATWVKILVNTTTPSGSGLRLTVQDPSLPVNNTFGQNFLWGQIFNGDYRNG